MSKWLAGLGVVAVLAVAAYFYFPGFQVRAELTKDRILNKIDEALGKNDVLKKTIEMDLQKADVAIGKLQKGRIEVTVRVEGLQAQVKTTEKQIADAKEALTKLQGYIATEGDAVIDGKTYNPKQLKDFANTVLGKHKELSTKLASQQRTLNQLDKARTVLQSQEDKTRQQVAALKGRMQEIEGDMIALKHMREAAQAVADTDQTIGAKLEDLDSKINELQVRVRTEVRYEDERLNNLDVSKDVKSADDIIKATQSSDDVLQEINKVLAK